MAGVEERLGELDGQPVFWREAPSNGDVPVVYVHGNPTTSDDWLPFLTRTGGIAPDMQGFGRSGKRGDRDYTMDGYDRWFEAFLDYLEVDRLRLVAHDWGAVALMFAQRHPERIERLVVMDAVPLLPGFRWHRIGRAWRTPVLGETAMGMLARPVLKFLSREMNATKGPMPGMARMEGTLGMPSSPRMVRSATAHMNLGHLVDTARRHSIDRDVVRELGYDVIVERHDPDLLPGARCALPRDGQGLRG